MTPSSGANPFQRDAMLRRLAQESFDLVVVGGGITGVGIALDAATRGLRTALVERDDFASGTSSKSSKLVHGGLRYLQQGEVRLVYEALHERQRLRKNAPHLVRVLPFMIPILTRDGVVSRKIARVLGTSMWMYDLTGGWRIGKLHKRLKRDAAFAHLPTMPKQRLASAYLYYDAAADDARLCLAVARTAALHGAAVANRCNVVEVLTDANGSAHTVVVETGNPHDPASDSPPSRISIRTRLVINASGVWADEVRALAEAKNPESIRPAKGVHITVAWSKVRNDIAVVIPVPKDKRSLFVVPWGPQGDGTFLHTYVGTTDTDYDGDIDDPQCTKDDLDYVLRALNASVTTGITADDVTGVWAGLRPLVKSASSGRTADLSRRHSITTNAAGVISVAGGKLTTYREMAEDTVDQAVKSLSAAHDPDATMGPRRPGKCRTKSLRLVGGDGFKEPSPDSPESHLALRYGTEASVVRDLCHTDPSLADPLVPGLPYIRAEALYAVRSEMAVCLDDVLTRRTRARLFDRQAALDSASSVAALIGVELGWSQDRIDAEVADFSRMCVAESEAARTAQKEPVE